LPTIATDVTGVTKNADKTLAKNGAAKSLQDEVDKLNSTKYEATPKCPGRCACDDLNKPNAAPWPNAAFDVPAPGEAGWTIKTGSGDATATCPATVQQGLLAGVCKAANKQIGLLGTPGTDEGYAALISRPVLQLLAEYEALKLSHLLAKGTLSGGELEPSAGVTVGDVELIPPDGAESVVSHEHE
jgi:hypothetical protein